jgi:DNA-binding transcriptional regulator YiaG
MANRAYKQSLSHSLKHHEIQQLVKFAGILESVNIENPSDFQKVIHAAVEQKYVAPADLADHFGVSRGTVSRWASGKNVPHAIARPIIIHWIHDHALSKAQELTEQCKQDQCHAISVG